MIHLFDVIENIRHLGDDVVVLASGRSRERLLLGLSNRHLLPVFSIRDFSFLDLSFSNQYLLHMKTECHMEYALADALRPFFSYAERFQLLPKEKAELLQRSFVSLKEKHLISPAKMRSYRQIIALNRQVVTPSGFRDPINTLYSGSIRKDPLPVYPVSDKSEEIDAVVQQILRWVMQGIDPDQIRIVNANELDEYQLDKWLKEAGIPFFSSKHQPLRKYPQTIRLIEILKNPSTENDVIDFLDGLKIEQPLEQRVKQAFIHIINRYTLPLLLEYPDLFIYELRSADIAPLDYRGAVQSIALSELYPDDEVFYLVLNSHESELPVKKMDVDFLSDQDKMVLGCETSFEANTRTKAQLSHIISRLKNCALFYAKTDAGKEYHFPQLDLDCLLEVIPVNAAHQRIFACRELDRLEYAKMQYDLKTYGIFHPEYSKYAAMFPEDNASYHYQFSGLTSQTSARILARGVVLSATSLERFHRCPFQYLLTDVLRVTPKDTALSLFFGNIAHAILANNQPVDLSDVNQISRLYEENFPPDKIIRKPVFLQAFHLQIEKTQEYLAAYDHHSLFVPVASEAEYFYQYAGKNIRIQGKIDQIRTWHHDGKNHLIVIDFKTGSKQFEDSDFSLGLDIQLPFYLHMIMSSKKDQEVVPCGFYYQRLLPGHYPFSKNTDPLKLRLALNGKTINDPVVFSALGGDNGWIKHCRKKSDGTLKAGKHVIQAEELSNMIDEIKKRIDDAVNAIEAGSYLVKPIPPLPNQSWSSSCQYCPHMGLCHLSSDRTDSDDSEEEEETANE